MVLERTIDLPGVAGRIDHLAFDATSRRLFVAELGAGEVEAIDVGGGRSLGRIANLAEPQGVGYLPGLDELAVATGGDGMVRFYRAADLKLVASLALGADADDVRVDPTSGRLVVGFGQGLAVIDPAARTVVSRIALPAHPEGFQINGARAFVNLPGAGEVAVIDLAAARIVRHWRNPSALMNFPMALDAAAERMAVVYRLPNRLIVFDTSSGQAHQRLEACGDADDVYFDPTRHRIYAICGSGAVDVFEEQGAGYAAAVSVATRSGARTGLYAEDRLFVAARATSDRSAAILVYRPR